MNNDSQNSIVTLITLNKVLPNNSTCPIEVNPAFIVYMQRSTHNDFPVTILQLAYLSEFIYILETPQEVSDRQMELMTKALNSLVGTMVNRMDETFGGDGFLGF